uniref:RRM domain-containing protein n=1 Tax=Chenopodium quinoa TaxID=63459 RepID=A0A803LGM7_CHEQI
MSHFGRTGPPDIADTYSLLVLNITFRTTPDDLFPLFDKYGKVVDIFIPRDRRTGESRGFTFVRYKYADEAQKAVDRLDGRVVDGREIAVQFAKYGPNAEKMYRDDYDRDRVYSRRRSRSRSLDRYDRDRYRRRDRDYRRRSRSRSYTPEKYRSRGRDGYDDDRSYRSRSADSASPRRSRSPRRSISPRRSASPRSPSRSRSHSPEKRSPDERTSVPRRSASPQAVSPHNGPSAHKSVEHKKTRFNDMNGCVAVLLVLLLPMVCTCCHNAELLIMFVNETTLARGTMHPQQLDVLMARDCSCQAVAEFCL